MNVPSLRFSYLGQTSTKYEVMGRTANALHLSWTSTQQNFTRQGLQHGQNSNGRIDDTHARDQEGIDRRTSLHRSSRTQQALPEEEALLRQEVFERLNTGGIKISNPRDPQRPLYGNSTRFCLSCQKPDLPRYLGIPKSSESAERTR